MLNLGIGLLIKVPTSDLRGREKSKLIYTTAFEQFGNIENLVVCISEIDAKTGRPLCSPVTCPVMSAGRSVVAYFLVCLY